MERLNNGIIRANRSNNSEYRRVLSDYRDGRLLRLRNGLYAHPEALSGNIVDIQSIVPGGILCLYSAWAYHNLTTQIPDAFYVAVERTRKVRLPVFPDIKLVFQRKGLLGIGRTVIETHGLKIAVTDLERSVCDAVKYRNKIGLDVMKEIIDSYLRNPVHNLSRLSQYARDLRVYTTLHQILILKL